jgi:Holliday junction resolvase
MTPEAKVKQSVVKILKEYEVYYFFPATGGYGRSGVPDIIACFKGHFIAIECKTKTNSPTALQLREIQKIIVAGGDAVVINEDNLELVRGVIDAYIKSN